MKQTKPILDIALLTAGRVDLFSKCVDAVLAQMKPEYKIHVFNNGSPSPEYNIIYKRLPEGSSVKQSNQMSGFSDGANKVINSGSSNLVLFITDDVFLHAGAIEVLLDRMKDETIGLCGLKLLFPLDSEDSTRPAGKVQHIGMASNIRGEMFHPLIGWSPSNPKCCVSTEVLAVTGASFIVRRDIFNTVRGFNPIYGRGYYEDMDLCFSIRNAGKRIFIDTQAVATHGVGQTFKDAKEKPNFQQNMNTFRSRWLSQMPWSEFLLW